MRRRLSLPACAIPVALFGCGASPAPGVPIAAPPVDPAPRNAPAGEVWLTPDSVAALTFVHPRPWPGAKVRARVATDDARMEQAHAEQSGVVRSIAVEAGREGEPGAVLLPLDVDVASARNTSRRGGGERERSPGRSDRPDSGGGGRRGCHRPARGLAPATTVSFVRDVCAFLSTEWTAEQTDRPAMVDESAFFLHGRPIDSNGRAFGVARSRGHIEERAFDLDECDVCPESRASCR